MSASREDYIRYKMQRSNEVFDDALLLAANGRWNSAMNRLYYSSFYLVSALLYKHRIKAETHNGTKTSFFFHFVKNEMVEREFGKLYANLLDWCQESDYADFAEFDEETINVLLERVKQFNNTISRLLDE
ncbi:MAG TPA: HEPN domain-containing protein [Flavipsychrobacter sp.]|nr:HEPN domain-containing protein [Flavipsychrobacter sp.]